MTTSGTSGPPRGTAGAAVAPPTVGAPEAASRTLAVVSVSTLLVLATFVTPLATGARTAVAFGTGVAGQAWLLSAMSVGLAAALLVAGAVADQVGRRRVFVGGLGLLALGAVTAAAAGSTGVFLAGRLLEGVGGAAVLACSLGLISSAFPLGPARARAAAVWGASVGAGTGVGGLLAVAVDTGEGWRGSYVVTAVLAVLLAAAARLVLLPSGPSTRRPIDVAGPLLLVAAVTCLLVGLVQTRSGGGPVPVLLFLLLGAGLAAAFVLAEHRVAAPLIDLSLFRVPGFVAAAVGAFVTGAAVVGVMSFLATVVMRALGGSLPAVTLLVVVWSVVSTVTALAVRLIPAFDGRILLAAGLALSAAGLAALAVLAEDASGNRLLPGLLVLGIGYGAANAALGRESVAHVPAHRAAMGSGANNTARYLGAAIGVTLVVLVTVSGAPAGTAEGLTGGWNAAALGAAGVSAAGALAVLLIRPRRLPD
ncbi:MFS transporter [Blastococcus sp. CT_GayMR20]|uniref:MFS transporter n=1 Tax=Blastococcus sp. CT_GayMR20 TaxID=2559609 RepID=UPI001073BB52|nr:MFS transporter [Blastococcus sp. CT_GayMR20]TFV87316.1 MFS transporter [Blastococcus sp. CT_GayMR20]